MGMLRDSLLPYMVYPCADVVHNEVHVFRDSMVVSFRG